MRGAFELDDAQLPNHSDITVCGGGPQAPQATTPGILHGRFVDPCARAVHPITACATQGLCLVEEPQRYSGKAVDCSAGAAFPRGDDEDTRHIICAVPGFRPRFSELGMLERSARVRHP
ncbi:hypothetical protein MMAGJ_09360 [Mycolicibacterium mageritense]|uniref:Uncharacterized protein n=1 Tax=Mycolicibacterium mageritense TaxID=53462 RepID=A0ABM7HMC1_MYCME|nr:hypothetical protein MMAGJ_09360 [Mycolicibacterium mageritense]